MQQEHFISTSAGDNVINGGAVKARVSELAADQRHESVRTWLKTVATKYIINNGRRIDVPEAEAAAPDAPDWMRAAHERGDRLVRIALDSADDDVHAVLDYLNHMADNGTRFDRMSYPEAVKQSEEWHEELARRAQEESAKAEDGISAPILRSGSYYWVEVFGESSLAREGDMMGHCVGGANYLHSVQSGKIKIYSLRDEKNRPHVTIEYSMAGKKIESENARSYIAQIKGKANGALKPEYAEPTLDLLFSDVLPNKMLPNDFLYLARNPYELDGLEPFADAFTRRALKERRVGDTNVILLEPSSRAGYRFDESNEASGSIVKEGAVALRFVTIDAEFNYARFKNASYQYLGLRTNKAGSSEATGNYRQYASDVAREVRKVLDRSNATKVENAKLHSALATLASGGDIGDDLNSDRVQLDEIGQFAVSVWKEAVADCDGSAPIRLVGQFYLSPITYATQDAKSMLKAAAKTSPELAASAPGVRSMMRAMTLPATSHKKPAVLKRRGAATVKEKRPVSCPEVILQDGKGKVVLLGYIRMGSHTDGSVTLSDTVTRGKALLSLVYADPKLQPKELAAIGSALRASVRPTVPKTALLEDTLDNDSVFKCMQLEATRVLSKSVAAKFIREIAEAPGTRNSNFAYHVMKNQKGEYSEALVRAFKELRRVSASENTANPAVRSALAFASLLRGWKHSNKYADDLKFHRRYGVSVAVKPLADLFADASLREYDDGASREDHGKTHYDGSKITPFEREVLESRRHDRQLQHRRNLYAAKKRGSSARHMGGRRMELELTDLAIDDKEIFQRLMDEFSSIMRPNLIPAFAESAYMETALDYAARILRIRAGDERAYGHGRMRPMSMYFGDSTAFFIERLIMLGASCSKDKATAAKAESIHRALLNAAFVDAAPRDRPAVSVFYTIIAASMLMQVMPVAEVAMAVNRISRSFGRYMPMAVMLSKRLKVA